MDTNLLSTDYIDAPLQDGLARHCTGTAGNGFAIAGAKDRFRLPFREPAVSSSIPPLSVPRPQIADRITQGWIAVQPLLGPFAGAWLILVALGTLMQSRALRVFDAGRLPYSDYLRDAAYVLAPDALLTSTRHSAGGMLVLALYVLLACAAVVCWCWAVRLAKSIQVPSIVPLLFLTGFLASPLIAYTGLFSDDVYLYNMYGRMIDSYGANPLLHAPSAFAHDPHYPWVHWKALPSSYGPLWLMVSAPLSALAGDSLSAAIIVYRSAALLLHLSVAATIWMVLRRTRPRDALAFTVFYAWNPLVLLEVVGNAHNDVFVALFAVLMMAAVAHRAWASAAFFGACAVMVKPYAVLLMPALAMRILRTPAAARPQWRRLAVPLLVFGAACIGLSLPLWAGMPHMLANIARNPASYAYTNTLWEPLTTVLASWLGTTTAALREPYVSAVRMSCFLTGALWILTRAWARRDMAKTSFALWMLFTLTAAWVWPWYVLPAIALSVFAGRMGIAVATSLTIGGLLFWATWTPPPHGVLYAWRSLILFGPLMITLAWPSARAALLGTLGSPHAAPPSDEEGIRVRLQTATG